MKPTPTLATAVSNRLAGASLNRSIGALGTCRELPEDTPSGYCRAATSLLGNFTGSNSVSACTATHPHRCVQDLIKEELGGISLPGRAASMGGAGVGGGYRLSKAGSMINMVTAESDLYGVGGGGGSQSHPASGRSSPAFVQSITPVGSPPRFVNTLGPSSYGGGSARVSRAPSPSLLHAGGGSSGGDHSSCVARPVAGPDLKVFRGQSLSLI
uniref:Uncharacterized protein n=1 Tax=Anopheles atroparvus TaxID=41427 RepID=A0A182JK78_ANOAO